jgi:HEAT repeat protein
MRLKQFIAFLALAIWITSCASSEEASWPASSFHSEEEVIQLINDLPAADDTENRWVFSELAALGPFGVETTADMLVAPGTGDDTRARYAMNGLVKYVSGAGTVSHKAMVEKALLAELKAGHSKAVKGFLMEQFELIGSNQSVPVLQSFIGDEVLTESALHALRAIDTPQAQQAVAEAIGTTEGENRAAVIKTLGDMEATNAAEDLLPYASSSDWPTQKAALYALAQTGDPAAAEPLAAAVDDMPSQEKTLAQSYYLQLAHRMQETGNMQQSTSVSRDILSGDYEPHAKSAALSILYKSEGEATLEELLEAAAGSDERLRFTALSILKKQPQLDVPESWLNQFDSYPPEAQAHIIAMLGPGRASVSMLMPYVKSSDPAVRSAAIGAVATMGGDEARSGLMDALLQALDGQTIAALQKAMLQLPGERLISEAAQALPSASPAARAALIEILAERRANGQLDLVINQLDGADSKTRMAVYQSLRDLAAPGDLPQLIALLPRTQNGDERSAIQDAVVSVSGDMPGEKQAGPVVEAINASPQKQKPYLLEMLPGLGGRQALDAAVKGANSSDEAVRQAAIEALAQWPDASALSPLKQVLKEASSPDERKAILSGYVRLVGPSKYTAEDKIGFLRDAMAQASSPEEKTIIIDGFSAIDSPEALGTVAQYFDSTNEGVREQSLRTAAKILARSDASAGRELSLVGAMTSVEAKNKIDEYIGELNADNNTAGTFSPLFNGSDLSGWTGATDSYRVEDGQIISKEGASGNLFTEQEYSDFILKFDFKLTPGANNGLGIRTPLEGDPAYEGMELQILDNASEKYADLQPYQFHGSVYGVAPAEQGYLKPAGQWNTQEVVARGSQIMVKVNGQTILNTDLEEAGRPETMDGQDHPGLFRESGHIGFLGHGHEVAFRDIRIRDLNVYLPDYGSNSGDGNGMNQPPEGFTALFNGQNLQGWEGLVGNPESRTEMGAQELARKKKEANANMRRHWSVREGILQYDGEGESLVTEKDYGDFEMLVDWKIEPGGDSGIYLRGTPQVQIWDITEWPQGSGGLYNNQNHPGEPLVPADNAIGEWNSMRIKMVGEQVTVHLNDQLVVPGVVMENYWNRDKSIYPVGQIELQQHDSPLYFKNIFIREIPREQKLFNGQNLSGWTRVGGEAGGWHASGGLLYTEGGGEKWEKGTGGGWLSTTEKYDDFKLELEYRLPEGGNSGVFLRAPREGDPAFEGLEIQLLDDSAEQYQGLDPWQYTGSIYDVKAPSKQLSKKAGQWQKMEIVANGPRLKVKLNGQMIINTSLVNFMDKVGRHPGLKRRSGYIGLQNHNSRVEFRNIKITEIN